MCFDPAAAVSFIMMGLRIYIFMKYFLDDSLSVSISSKIVWIGKLDYFHEGIYFANNDCHGNRKKAISQLS